MTYDFYAYLARMKYIKRWCLMHSEEEENIKEHSFDVIVISHALALIGNAYYGKDYDVEKVVLYAAYHETSEVITGDLPTPVKYFNESIHGAYKDLETLANKKILATLPEELRVEYEKSVLPDTQSKEYRLVKCADRLSAYIKCLEELKIGNKEFAKAKTLIYKDIEKMPHEEVKYFVKNVLPSYGKTLDELE